MKADLLSVFFFLFLHIELSAQETDPAPGGEFCFMIYNIENMFHPSLDSSGSDLDFSPSGVRYWTYERYYRKVGDICKVIRAANSWEPPTIIGFTEVEDARVLKDIIFHPLLKGLNYKFVHREGPDHRSIEPAILYNSTRMTHLADDFIPLRFEDGSIVSTREILVSKFLMHSDTLYFILNHWTSRYGGRAETISGRMRQARTLRSYIDSLVKRDSSLYLLVGGDFNAASTDPSIQYLCERDHITELVPQNGYGSYKYQGKWEYIDHWFAGGKLTAKHCQAELLLLPQLLEKDEKYTGIKPRRTYIAYTYNGGLSDHLPVLIRVRFPEGAGD